MKIKPKDNSISVYNLFTISIISTVMLIISCSPAKILQPEEALKFISENHKTKIIIDIREVSSYATGHIKNAENIPYKKDNFQQRVSYYDKDAHILIYCGKGLKTSEAAELLKDSGFKNIYVIEGGFDSWKNQGYEISN